MFFALWPDAITAGHLHALARGLREQYGGRVMRRDTLHLTLAFVGDVGRGRLDELRRIAAALRGQAFSLRLDHTGGWQGGRIVWAAPESAPAALTDLAASLCMALHGHGYAVDRRTFAPHITLLRNAGQVPEQARIKAFEWRVGGFSLLESLRLPGAACYRRLGRWPLMRR